jgi:hypothetical protein
VSAALNKRILMVHKKLKKMDRICLKVVTVTITILTLYACTKQTTPEALPVQPVLQRSGDYFANLRAYKQSDHQIYFGWFGGTGSAGNPQVPGVLDQIPDSVDIVSLWGGMPPLGSYNDSILRKTRQLKGTRFVLVKFSNSDFLNAWSDTNFVAAYDKGDSMLKAGFELIAKRLTDSIEAHALDGVDLDHEPHLCGCDWGLFKDGRKFSLFLTVLAKYFGPSSATGKLLIVDGEYSMISSKAAQGLSYIVTQAYNTGSPFGLQSRFNSLPAGFPPGKFIVTENFEDHWQKGGVNFFDPVRGTIPSLLGMAYWNPTQGRKGGCGTYHSEYEYALNPDYKYTRQAIQIMNPAAK